MSPRTNTQTSIEDNDEHSGDTAFQWANRITAENHSIFKDVILKKQEGGHDHIADDDRQEGD